jgi:hypothetical protein
VPGPDLVSHMKEVASWTSPMLLLATTPIYSHGTVHGSLNSTHTSGMHSRTASIDKYTAFLIIRGGATPTLQQSNRRRCLAY